MPTKTEYNTCKVCNKQNVKFTYWETASGTDPYRTNYEEKLAKAFICSSCHNNLKESLKNQNKEICSPCWNKVTWGNFETTSWSKEIGKECNTCHNNNNQQLNPNREQDQPIQNTPPNISSQSTPISNNYTSSPTTNDTPISTNCYECKKIISIGNKVYVWPHEPNKKYCENCGIQQELFINYLKGIENGEDLTSQIEKDNKLSSRIKTNLLSAQKIKHGEEANIDNLPLNEEDKQGLRNFKNQCPVPSVSLDYTIKCKGCSKEQRVAIPNILCQFCNSSNIEIWKDGKVYKGKQSQKNTTDPTKTFGLDHDTFALLIFAVIFIPLFIWLIFRWRRKRKDKLSQIK